MLNYHPEPLSTTLNDSSLNDSIAGGKTKKKRTLQDYEFVINENSKFKTSDLGKGSYGTVKKCRDKHTGKIYAMKIMNKKAIFEYSTKENLKREITIQKEISHPHIVKLYTYFEDTENVYLVLEFAENGSLFHYLRKRRKFSEEETFVYFFQTCLGIDYLHKRRVIHRDLKPENLLLDEDGNIKLCDFGWSADTGSKRHTFCGTVDYMAPEMLKNHPYDHRLDIWCLGILLYEMLHGFAPFKGRNDSEICKNISANSAISFDPSLSPYAVDLIRKILQPVPVNRISMNGIFTHPWMKELEKKHKIKISDFVEQQDEQIRELERTGDVRILSKDVLGGSKTDVSGKNSGGTNNAKIITIVDKTTPLHISQKINSDENKKASYNGSTKESDTGSTGSINTSTTNIEQILKGYNKAESAGLKKTNVDYYKPNVLSQSANFGTSHYPVKTEPGVSGNDLSNINLYILQEEKRKKDIESFLKKDPFVRRKSGQVSWSASEIYAVKQKSQPESYNHEQNRYEKAQTYRDLYINEDDEEPYRLSRISQRTIDIQQRNQYIQKEKKEVGLIEKVLVGLGCISRETKKY